MTRYAAAPNLRLELATDTTPPATAAASSVAAWYELTKPRLNLLVLVTTAVGFLVTTRDTTDAAMLLHVLVGTALAAAGAGVLNQVLERDADARMNRTRMRPLVTKAVRPGAAAAFGVILCVGGVAYLATLTNVLTAALAAVTVVTYVGIYSPLKRLSPLCTPVGALSGAIPPMMGVTAATGELSAAAWVLFAVLFLWQMPHFYGLATLYRDDYAAGGFRMLPGEPDGTARTARHVVVYLTLLVPVSLAAVVVPGVTWLYAACALVLGLWYWTAGVRFAHATTRLSARRLFLVSIAYLPALLLVLVLDALAV